MANILRAPGVRKPRFIASGDANSNAATITLAIPAEAQAGDLLIVGLSTFGRTATTPSGWTLIASQARSSTSYGYLFYKIHNGTDTSVTVTMAGTGTTHLASIKVWRGVNQSSPIGNIQKRQVTADVSNVVFSLALSTSAPNSVVSYWTGTATTSAFTGLAWTNATPASDNFLIGTNKYILGSAYNEFPVAGATPVNVAATRTGSGTVNNWFLIWFEIKAG